MKLRTKYLLFVILLHAAVLGLSFFIFDDNKLLFILAEAVVLVSAFLSWRLYLQLIRPLQTMLQGVDAIRDRDFNVRFLQTGKYEMDQLIGVYNDMMDHLREERTRQEEQHFFLEKLIQTSPTGIVILDFDECIYQMNPKAEQLLGLDVSVVAGKPIASLDHVLLNEMARLETGRSEVLTRGGVATFKIQKSQFVDRGFVRPFILIEEMTEEILAAEKRAYGKVIRMMAHEVNNTIGPVNSIMQSALASGEQREDLGAALEIAIQRNSNLNHFMRNFADLVRLPAPNKKPVMLGRFVEEVVLLMRRSLHGNQTIEIHGDAGGWQVMADAHLLEQVLINVIKNALEAIDEDGRVEIILDGAARRLVVRDNGTGIEPEAAEKLFSAFFSTKQQGQGIGLTLVREVLMAHGFGFSLRTLSPGLTEFEIRTN